MTDNDSREASRRATFKAATKGLRAYTIALKLRESRIHPSVDFRGSAKCHIEDSFSVDDGFLADVTEGQLREAMK